MFEKEAEEYEKRKYEAVDFGFIDYYGIRNAFQEGAEFGYKKANKWYKVADGDLPKDNRNVLVATRADVYEGFYENGFWYGAGGGKLRVTAWCEIPKYKEE